MKISIYGAGNQDFYINKLRVPTLFDGAPYGGSRMAIEFAEAGHDVVLAEPDRNKLTEEMWKRVEEAGVKITNNDIEAAKHGEVHIFYTPTLKTLEIAKKIIPYVPKDAIILTTCNISPPALHSSLKYELRKREGIGISSLHPASIPGTPFHDRYVIGNTSLDGNNYLTEEQLNKCVQLAESVNKKAYVVPLDTICPIGNKGSSLLTAVALAGILEYYDIGTKVMEFPEDAIEREIVMVLQVLASIVETSGVPGLLKALNVELVIKSASSLCLTEDGEILETALKKLENIDEELLEKVKNAKINPTTPVASQELVKELRNLIGGKAAEGIIERSMKKLFIKH